MASSPPANSLTELQKELLAAFFDREKGFFLTGGDEAGDDAEARRDGEVDVARANAASRRRADR